MRADPARPAPLARLWRHTRGHRGAVVAASSCSILNKFFDLAPPVLIGLAVDAVVSEADSPLAGLAPSKMGQLWWIAGLTVVVWALESLFQYWYGVLWRNLAQSVQHELRCEAYGHVQGLELGWFEDQSTGTLMSVLNDDINQLERFLDVGANDIWQLTTTCIVIPAVFFYLAPQVAWVAMVPIPFILLGSVWYQRLLAPRYAAVREQVGLLNHQLANNLGGIATIKSFTAERSEAARIAGESEAYRAANRRAIRLSSAFSPLIRMVIVVGFLATLVWGGAQVPELLSVGSYSVMVFLTQRLLWPLTRIGETFDLYQRAMASTERVLDLLAIRPGLADGATPLPRAQVAGTMALTRVQFAYRDGPPVLRDLTLTFPAGRTTAIVGSTGAGKSTLVKLLLRFYDPTAGACTLDGHDLRALRGADLRHAIGLVSQDVFLFHGTVRANIAFGRPDATDAELIAAAVAAEAHEFITELSNGYDTIVGERGQKLSGGQRQRIAIARAVLKDPPILVLDEATSSVDNETEAAIQRSLARIGVGRTVIAIAHRLSTIRHADRIHVLERGVCVEAGTHDELLAREGVYAGLWKVQTGEAVAVSRP